MQHVSSFLLASFIQIYSCNSGHSAISLDEKYIVVSNLYDGLDWYSVADRALSHTVHCPINQQMNLPIPVLFTGDGGAIITGGTCGSVRVLDASTSETVQTLPHSGKSRPNSLVPFIHPTPRRGHHSSGRSSLASLRVGMIYSLACSARTIAC